MQPVHLRGAESRVPHAVPRVPRVPLADSERERPPPRVPRAVRHQCRCRRARHVHLVRHDEQRHAAQRFVLQAVDGTQPQHNHQPHAHSDFDSDLQRQRDRKGASVSRAEQRAVEAATGVAAPVGGVRPLDRPRATRGGEEQTPPRGQRARGAVAAAALLPPPLGATGRPTARGTGATCADSGAALCARHLSSRRTTC